MEKIILTIEWSETNNGYMYEIYPNEEAQENGDSLDGGLCTGSMIGALGMATDQAGHLLEAK